MDELYESVNDNMKLIMRSLFCMKGLYLSTDAIYIEDYNTILDMYKDDDKALSPFSHKDIDYIVEYMKESKCKGSKNKAENCIITNYDNTKKRVITLFSGLGCQELALKRCNIDYELINWCEIDKGASDSYKILHNEDDRKNLGDITKLDVDKYNVKDIDLLTCSFPCCSFSTMGNNEGFDCKKNGNLFDYSFRVIEKVMPRVVLFENVKNITSKKFNGDVY
eukprot:Awhi_evm2s11249